MSTESFKLQKVSVKKICLPEPLQWEPDTAIFEEQKSYSRTPRTANDDQSILASILSKWSKRIRKSIRNYKQRKRNRLKFCHNLNGKYLGLHNTKLSTNFILPDIPVTMVTNEREWLPQIEPIMVRDMVIEFPTIESITYSEADITTLSNDVPQIIDFYLDNDIDDIESLKHRKNMISIKKRLVEQKITDLTNLLQRKTPEHCYRQRTSRDKVISMMNDLQRLNFEVETKKRTIELLKSQNLRMPKY